MPNPPDTVIASLRLAPATVAELAERTGYDTRSVLAAIRDARKFGTCIIAQMQGGLWLEGERASTIFMVDTQSEDVGE